MNRAGQLSPHSDILTCMVPSNHTPHSDLSLTASEHERVSDKAKHEEDLGGDKEEEDLGGDKEEEDLGGDKEEENLGGDKEEENLGGDKEQEDLGGDKKEENLGGDKEEDDLGGDKEEEDLDGDKEEEDLGGDKEEEDLGGDKEEEDLGGDKEEEDLGGDKEEENLGGDKEEDNLGGDKEEENENLGGDKEEENLGGDKEEDLGGDKEEHLGGDKKEKNLSGNKEEEDLGGDKEEDLGGDKEQEDLGGDKEEEDLGGVKEEEDLGGDKEEEDLGGDKEEEDLGGDKEEEDLGGDKEEEDLGGDKEEEDLGGDKEEESLGGDKEQEDLGGDKEEEDLGGDKEEENLGGDKEEDDLGEDKEEEDLDGDKEEEDLGGDKEEEDLGGDKEEEHLGGDKEEEHLGGDKEEGHLGGDRKDNHLEKGGCIGAIGLKVKDTLNIEEASENNEMERLNRGIVEDGKDEVKMGVERCEEPHSDGADGGGDDVESHDGVFDECEDAGDGVDDDRRDIMVVKEHEVAIKGPSERPSQCLASFLTTSQQHDGILFTRSSITNLGMTVSTSRQRVVALHSARPLTAREQQGPQSNSCEDKTNGIQYGGCQHDVAVNRGVLVHAAPGVDCIRPLSVQTTHSHTGTAVAATLHSDEQVSFSLSRTFAPEVTSFKTSYSQPLLISVCHQNSTYDISRNYTLPTHVHPQLAPTDDGTRLISGLGARVKPPAVAGTSKCYSSYGLGKEPLLAASTGTCTIVRQPESSEFAEVLLAQLEKEIIPAPCSSDMQKTHPS